MENHLRLSLEKLKHHGINLQVGWHRFGNLNNKRQHDCFFENIWERKLSKVNNIITLISILFYVKLNVNCGDKHFKQTHSLMLFTWCLYASTYILSSDSLLQNLKCYNDQIQALWIFSFIT